MIKTPSFRLDGKRALVVGASSGIGQACAIALGEYGAEVYAAARRQDALYETKTFIEKIGASAQTVLLDISDIAVTEAWVAQNGPFDILINSAGLAKHSPALETIESDFR